MPLVPIENLSQYGVVKDVRDLLLPVNAWTEARNVRFQDGSIYNVRSAQAIFDPISIAPYWNLHTVAADNEGVWIFAGLEKVQARIGESNVDITRVSGDYSATEDGLWVGGVLGGIPILNNGIDPPQQWAPITSAQKLVDLQNWPTTWRCESIRPFKNFLIAVNILEDTSRFIHRVRWSHPAEPGAVPISWDALDPTVDAGRFDLPDVLSGGLVDGAPLRDIFILGKEKALWGMQFIGGREKFRIFSISSMMGIMAKNCMTPDPDGSLIFFASGDDIGMTDGLKVTSLVDKRVRKWLQANIDTNYYRRSFCVTDEISHECWFCFPTAGSVWPNLALVWEKQTNAVSFRDLPGLSYASPGTVPGTTSAWSADSLPWSQDFGRWTELAHQPFLRPLVGTAPVTGEMLTLDLGDTALSSLVERTGLSVNGMSSSGQAASDPTRRKLVKRVYLEGKGGTVNVSVGTQVKIGSNVTWSNPRSFSLNKRIAADFHQQGVLWGLRLQSVEAFELSRIVVELEDISGAF